MSRVGDIHTRIPLFTRDQQENVTRYLVHLTRALEDLFDEVQIAVNDNDDRIEAMQMRRWFMDGY